MRITLAEVGGDDDGQSRSARLSRSFEQPLVRLGRDPLQCDVVFEDSPMVSRRHAELSWQNGRWMLSDAKSSFGTFLDGQRVGEPVVVAAGARFQLGAGGPVISVVSTVSTTPGAPAGSVDQLARGERANFETNVILNPGEMMAATPATRDVAPPARNVPLTTSADASRRPPPPQPPPSADAQSAFLEPLGGEKDRPERVRLDRPSLMLGRDASSAVKVNAAAAAVSRRHAEIQRRPDQYYLLDLGSFNGTLLNDQRIAQPAPLYHHDRIQLGLGGPLFRFIDPLHQRAVEDVPAAAAAIPKAPSAPNVDFQRTMAIRTHGADGAAHVEPAGASAQLLMECAFDAARRTISVGRATDNDLRLDGLQISNHHARLTRGGGEEEVTIEDAGSTNGIYVNGVRLANRQTLGADDVVQIGPFVLKVDAGVVSVFDARSKTGLDAVGLTKTVANRSGGGIVKLLDDVSLSIRPNEFVGLLGPSGAGKSTLMDALNGMRPATAGHVYYNDLDLYQHPDSLKQSIGYVPQDDIIHRELTVYRTLYYVARLRLSRDVSDAEMDQIIGEVLDVTGLAERRDVVVSQLSGGQRKRVSIAVELITKPSVIFLDEPTSGLDPATEDKIMRLFRQIAESGRTVILTTHAMENVKLFDKVAVMMRGRLVFYGTPPEALAHLGAANFKDLYDKLEAPIETELRNSGETSAAAAGGALPVRLGRAEITERVADDWRRRFQATDFYRRHVAAPLDAVRRGDTASPGGAGGTRRRAGVGASLRQWATLVRRYMEVVGRDRSNLLILFGQAPIIALFTYVVTGARDARDFPYFLLALVAVWFGTSVAAREIVKERAVYRRERMVNLGLWPYVWSKLAVLSVIVAAQSALLFGTLKLFGVAGLVSLPGVWGGAPQLLVMLLTGAVGIALGLLVSATVKTSEMATSVVPLLLIPQILFAGLVGVPRGVARAVGAAMPAMWSFDSLKRLSALDTLREEGSNAEGPNRGRGLYRHTEQANDENIAAAQRDVAQYRADAARQSEDYERRVSQYLVAARANPSLAPPEAPTLAPPPAVPPAQKISEDLSGYVDFLHPWGGLWRNPLILLAMFFVLVGATLAVLRAQDIK